MDVCLLLFVTAQAEMDGLKFSEDQEKQLKAEKLALEEKRTSLKDTCDQFV